MKDPFEQFRKNLIEDNWESWNEWFNWYQLQRYYGDPEYRSRQLECYLKHQQERLRYQKEYDYVHGYKVFPIEYKCYHCKTNHFYEPKNNIVKIPRVRCPNCEKIVSLRKYFQIRNI